MPSVISNGFITQWHYTENKGTSNKYSDTWNISFTSDDSYQIVTTIKYANSVSSGLVMHHIRERTATGFTVYTGGDTYYIRYIAVGY